MYIFITQKKLYNMDFYKLQLQETNFVLRKTVYSSNMHVSVCVCMLYLSEQSPAESDGWLNLSTSLDCTFGLQGVSLNIKAVTMFNKKYRSTLLHQRFTARGFMFLFINQKEFLFVDKSYYHIIFSNLVFPYFVYFISIQFTFC